MLRYIGFPFRLVLLLALLPIAVLVVLVGLILFPTNWPEPIKNISEEALSFLLYGMK